MQTLEGWLRALPNEHLKQNPWMLFWLAQCRMVVNPNEAAEIFEQVYDQFSENSDDPAGIFLAWCGVVDSILYSFGEYVRLDRWIDRLFALQDQHQGFPSPKLEAQVTFTMFGALLWARMGDPRIFEWESRARKLLGYVPDLSQRIILGFHLHHFWGWLGKMDKADEVYLQLKKWKTLGEVSPMARVFLYHLEATDAWLRGKGKAGLAAFRKGEKLVKEYGLSLVAMTLQAQGITAAVMTNNLELAKDLLEEIRPHSEMAPGLHGSQYYHMASWLALLDGELAKAQSLVERSIHLKKSIPNQFLQSASRHSLAQILIQRNELDQAEKQLSEIKKLNHIIQSGVISHWISQLKFPLAEVRGEREGRINAIQEFFGISRQTGVLIPLGWHPTTVARMCATALEEGIETRQARKMIKCLSLVPVDPLLTSAQWPWPVKIYTFGQFKLYRDNRVAELPKKGKSRPLSLLKALITLGAINVSHDKLVDLLWPEFEADAGHEALATTIRRLRELLGEPQALIRQEGKLSLNLSVCWVDALVFEALLKGIASKKKASSEGQDDQNRNRAIELYVGSFLNNEKEPWMDAYRQRLQGQFIRQVGYQAADDEVKDQAPQAIKLLERAIQKEPLVEPLYQQLMQILHRQGKKTRVQKVYEQCRKALKSKLGVEPGTETTKMAESLSRKRLTKLGRKGSPLHFIA